MNDARIAVRGLRVERARRLVVDVESLDLPAGEVLALIGPNGAGKTTLLMHMALLERAPDGAVLFDGAPVRGRELALRRRMAVAFQEPLLLDRSARANVELGLGMRGVPKGRRRERATRWMRHFGIEALAERSSRTLSGGEAQRTSLARAFALEPEVLLLDEPFSALDQPTREAIVDDLASALTATRATALVVTHSRDEAARLGHRVAVMIGGRIRQIGAPSEVLGAPVDEETAAFVGVETVIEGTVVERRGALVTLATVAGHEVEAVADGDFVRALICLRPEDVALHAPGEQIAGSARNKVVGKVARVSTGGADARVELDCGFRLIARVTRRSLDDLEIDAGSTLVATFKATAVHLIPK